MLMVIRIVSVAPGFMTGEIGFRRRVISQYSNTQILKINAGEHTTLPDVTDKRIPMSTE